MLNLTHKTTTDHINRWTKSELLEVIEDTGNAAPYMLKLKKSELVAEACAIRDQLVAAHEEKQAEAAQARQQQWEADQQDETFQAIRSNLLTAIANEMEAKGQTVTDAKSLCASSGDLAYVMRTNFEKVCKAQYQLRELLALTKFVSSDEYTKEEFLSILKETAKEATKRVLNSTEYEHRSTCQMSNLQAQAEFSGSQWKAKFLNQVVALTEQAFETGKWGNLQYSFYCL